MNNDWFFEKFALIADAPGAVDRIRELVLQMAIQGRLVQQDPTDEPANATLLKYPSTVSAKFIKTPDAGTPCPKITLPLGWVWNRLTNVLKKLTDGTHHSPPNSNFGEFPYVTAKNIKNHGIEISNLTYVTKELHNEIFSRCNPEHGDLLYIKDGATTGIVAINQLREEFSMLSSVALLKLTGAIDNRYLLWTLRSPFFYNQIRAAMKGAAITRVNLTELAQTWIPLPPLAEQKRIVAKVDELMGLCDELEAQQQERELRKSVLVRSSLSRFAESPTRENLGYLFHNSYDIPPSELRKSILTLAVQGKLVPQDPENEPADVLIERIITEKSALVNGKLMRSSNSHTTRDIDQIDGELPHGWAWTRIEEITSIGTGSTPLKSEKDYYANGDIPWVTSAATNNYFINEPDQFVTRKALKDYNLRIYPKGSLVIALYGQGKTRGQVGQLMFDATTNQACAVLEFFESGKSVRDYIRLFFLKKYDELRERAAGAAQPNLSGGMIRLTRVPLPPLAEQHRIVAKVDQLMALVDELERQQAASREKASNLLDAIVHEMTSGV
jgi:type I restriction enzyme S subunit